MLVSASSVCVLSLSLDTRRLKDSQFCDIFVLLFVPHSISSLYHEPKKKKEGPALPRECFSTFAFPLQPKNIGPLSSQWGLILGRPKSFDLLEEKVLLSSIHGGLRAQRSPTRGSDLGSFFLVTPLL